MANTFWSRWRKEFLQIQQGRQKWTETKRNLAVGDVVLLKEEDVGRGQWPMARVVEVHAGKDELVRNVSLQVGKSVLKRPIQKTVLLVAAKQRSGSLDHTINAPSRTNSTGTNESESLHNAQPTDINNHSIDTT